VSKKNRDDRQNNDTNTLLRKRGQGARAPSLHTRTRTRALSVLLIIMSSSDASPPPPAPAPPAPSSSRGGGAPAPLPCDAPGRRAYDLWRTRFVLDDRYEPIKVREEERGGGSPPMRAKGSDIWGALVRLTHRLGRRPSSLVEVLPTRSVVVARALHERTQRERGGVGGVPTVASPRPHHHHPFPLQAIGKGAYGVVASAVDTVTGDRVAIKKVRKRGRGRRRGTPCGTHVTPPPCSPLPPPPVDPRRL